MFQACVVCVNLCMQFLEVTLHIQRHHIVRCLVCHRDMSKSNGNHFYRSVFFSPINSYSESLMQSWHAETVKDPEHLLLELTFRTGSLDSGPVHLLALRTCPVFSLRLFFFSSLCRSVSPVNGIFFSLCKEPWNDFCYKLK